VVVDHQGILDSVKTAARRAVARVLLVTEDEAM
jgi:hypothetical protein